MFTIPFIFFQHWVPTVSQRGRQRRMSGSYTGKTLNDVGKTDNKHLITKWCDKHHGQGVCKALGENRGYAIMES